MNEIHFSSKSVEHYTPSNLVQAIQNFYNGVIDLDPCSNTDSPNVPACFHYNKSMNGLTLPWAGKVYVNPPYGRNIIDKWVEKAVVEYQAQRAREILLLLPARTDTQWFKLLNSYARLYFEGRLKFLASENKDNSAPFPSMLVYLGLQEDLFVGYWQSWGLVTKGQATATTTFDKKAYQREYMRRRRDQTKKSTDQKM